MTILDDNYQSVACFIFSWHATYSKSL